MNETRAEALATRAITRDARVRDNMYVCVRLPWVSSQQMHTSICPRLGKQLHALRASAIE